MASYFLAFTILVVISVAYGHGVGEGRGERGENKGRGENENRGESERNRGGSEHNPLLNAFEEFIRNLTTVQRDAFFNITGNCNLTKAELLTQIEAWAAGLEGEAKVLYQNLFTTYQELKANFTQKLEAEVANLTGTAKTVGEEILALIKNQSISYAATFKAIEDLIKAQIDDVRKELKPILPHVDAHQNHPLPRHGSECGNFARGSERGNFAHGGEHGNSDKHETRAKRLIK